MTPLQALLRNIRVLRLKMNLLNPIANKQARNIKLGNTIKTKELEVENLETKLEAAAMALPLCYGDAFGSL